MERLDSTLQTLILSSTGFDFLTVVCSFWTGIAVLTAAVIIYRKKVSQSRPRCHDDFDDHLPPSSDSGNFQRIKALDVSTLTASSGVERAHVKPYYGEPSSSSLETQGYYAGRCKGKFTVCFDGNGETALLPLSESLVDRRRDGVNDEDITSVPTARAPRRSTRLAGRRVDVYFGDTCVGPAHSVYRWMIDTPGSAQFAQILTRRRTPE